MGTHITYKRPDGKENAGYLANAKSANAPGVVVIQEWWGLDAHIQSVAQRLADAGFVALVPDLYRGRVTAEPDVSLVFFFFFFFFLKPLECAGRFLVYSQCHQLRHS